MHVRKFPRALRKSAPAVLRSIAVLAAQAVAGPVGLTIVLQAMAFFSGVLGR